MADVPTMFCCCCFFYVCVCQFAFMDLLVASSTVGVPVETYCICLEEFNSLVKRGNMYTSIYMYTHNCMY